MNLFQCHGIIHSVEFLKIYLLVLTAVQGKEGRPFPHYRPSHTSSVNPHKTLRQ